jgi:hypothetical protein
MGYHRVDGDPPISIQIDNIIRSDVTIYTRTYGVVTYSQITPVPTPIQVSDITEQDGSDDIFEPIDKYYDNLKNGYMELDGKLQDYLWYKCKQYDVDPYMIMAQICEESEYNPDAIHHNDNGTVDMGLAQINSRYEEYFEELIGRDFDPYNPYDAIDWLVFFYNYEREYWIDRGVRGDRLTMAILGSYNKGRDEMRSYISDYGYEYYYNRDIMSRREQLIDEHG